MASSDSRARARLGALVAGSLGALLLTGCTTTTTTTTAPTVDPLPSQSTGPELDLQLRPVLEVAPAGAGQCPARLDVTPVANQAASACSQDGKLVYSLGPAAVTGARVSDMTVSHQGGSPVVQISLDALGGAGLSSVTAEIAQLEQPRSQLAIVSHGRVQSAPVVTEQIDGRVMMVSGFADDAAAQAAIDFLAG